MKHVNNQSGFSLVELLVVIALLALLFALIVPKLVEAFNDSKDRIHEMTVKRLTDAAQMYLVLGSGEDCVWAPHPGTKAQDEYPAHDSWMGYLSAWPQPYKGQGYVVAIEGGKITVTP